MPERRALPLKLGRRLGVGKVAEVFALDGHVLKLYGAAASKASAFREAATLAIVGGFGLPTPSVEEVRRQGDRWGIVMERAEGPSFAEAIAAQPKLARRNGSAPPPHSRMFRATGEPQGKARVEHRKRGGA